MSEEKKNWGGGISRPPSRVKGEFSGPFTARGEETGEGGVIPSLEGQVGVTARERLLVSLHESGMGYREMAGVLGMTSVTGLRVSVSRAKKKLRATGRMFQIACERMEEEVVPLAVERMAGMVRAGVPEAVFRTLEGRGVLQGRGSQGMGSGSKGGAPTLQVSFTMVSNSPVVAVGGIVGAPRVSAGGTGMRAALPDVVSVPVMAQEVV